MFHLLLSVFAHVPRAQPESRTETSTGEVRNLFQQPSQIHQKHSSYTKHLDSFNESSVLFFVQKICSLGNELPYEDFVYCDIDVYTFYSSYVVFSQS